MASTLPIVCPAATEVDSDGVPSVLCAVLKNANAGQAINGSAERGQTSPVMHGVGDSVTVHRFCCDDGTSDNRTGYEQCAIWTAGRDSDDEGHELRDGQAERVDAAPRDDVTAAVEALRGGSLEEAAAIRSALDSGGVVLGG